MRYGLEFIEMKGLNRRTIAVVPNQVHFLEEAEIDGKIVTNVHMLNGKWLTAGLQLQEVKALLSPNVIEGEETESEKKEKQKQINRWREMAHARAEAQKEVNEALALIGPSLRSKSYHKEELPDGSGKLTIHYEPKKKNPNGTDSDDE